MWWKKRMQLPEPNVSRQPVCRWWAFFAAALISMLAACSSGPKRPVLYPDAHHDAVGATQANQDIDQCLEKARAGGVPETKDGEVGKRATQGAVIGGVGAGAWGLVRGSAGGRALAGAAAGAAAGTASGAFASTESNPTFRRFVERCLRDQGYDVIGWK